MIPVCNCADGDTIQNFGGATGCIDGIGVAEHAILLNNSKIDGTSNGIDTVNDTLDASFFNGKFKDVEPRERWLFLEGVTDFDAPAVDPITEDFTNGKVEKLADGVKEVTFFIITSEAAKLAAKLKASECRDLAIMYVDDNDSLIGELSGTDFIGRKIQNGSFDVQVIEKTYTTASKVQIKFKYDRSASETAVDYIKNSSISGFTLSSDAVALQDTRITYTSAALAALTFDLAIDFGGVESRIPAGGLTDAELEIYNVTQASVEATSSIVESPLGTYVATYSTPVASSDVMAVRGIGQVYVQKTYDLKALKGVQSLPSA